MYGFNYERLTQITENQKPYRGSKNRYPIRHRKNSEEYFLVEEENGEKVYDIVYGKKYHHEKIGKETYDPLKVTDPDSVWQSKEWDEHTQKVVNVDCYYRRWTTPNVLARVRLDNTVEFTEKIYRQGDRHFLTKYVEGHFATDSQRGGMLYIAPKIMHAIYKGMRLACDSGMALVPYEVELKRVDRNESKKLLKPYEDLFNTCDAMCSVTPFELFKDTTISVVEERFGSAKNLTDIDSEKLLHEAQACIQNAPFDALILYALGYDVNNYKWSFRYGRTANGDNGDRTHRLYMQTKRRILNELYKKHEEVFKTYRLKGGEYFPASKWGTDVIVNGEVMRQL